MNIQKTSRMIDKLRDVQRDSFVDLIRAYFKSGGIEIETPGVDLINSIADKDISDLQQKVN